MTKRERVRRHGEIVRELQQMEQRRIELNRERLALAKAACPWSVGETVQVGGRTGTVSWIAYPERLDMLWCAWVRGVGPVCEKDID